MRILDIFSKIAAIPHGSGNTKALSDFCLNYAKKRGYQARQDRWNNCLIRVPASPGREDRPAVILQGHLDMVCEKEPGLQHDFLKDGLQLVRRGDDLLARGTTLGGDDGIAIAYCLALLEEKELPHPPLELFFTADEETGMDGARGFDPAWLKGRRLLNLDSEEEGVFIVSSAGGRCVTGRLPLQRERCGLPVYQIIVEGLQGGHSGSEIHRGRANANILLGKILAGLPCRLIEAEGGLKNNAIPREARALVAMETPVDAPALTALFRREYEEREPDLQIRVATATADEMLEESCSKQAIALLSSLPDGVAEMSGEINGLVETSSNLGVLKTERDFLKLTVSIRSMKNTGRDTHTGLLTTLMEQNGALTEVEEGYPAWEYRKESALRETLAEAYAEIYGAAPKMVALHAGLECGIFASKLPGLDAVSIGPDIRDIHTTRERLSVSSAVRTWELLKLTLEKL